MKEGDTFDSSCLTWGYWKIIYQQLDTCYVASFPFHYTLCSKAM